MPRLEKSDKIAGEVTCDAIFNHYFGARPDVRKHREGISKNIKKFNGGFCYAPIRVGCEFCLARYDTIITTAIDNVNAQTYRGKLLFYVLR